MKVISLRHIMLYGMGIRHACTERAEKVPVFVQFGVEILESEVTDGMYRNVAQVVELVIDRLADES